MSKVDLSLIENFVRIVGAESGSIVERTDLNYSLNIEMKFKDGYEWAHVMTKHDRKDTISMMTALSSAAQSCKGGHRRWKLSGQGVRELKDGFGTPEADKAWKELRARDQKRMDDIIIAAATSKTMGIGEQLRSSKEAMERQRLEVASLILPNSTRDSVRDRLKELNEKAAKDSADAAIRFERAKRARALSLQELAITPPLNLAPGGVNYYRRAGMMSAMDNIERVLGPGDPTPHPSVPYTRVGNDISVEIVDDTEDKPFDPKSEGNKKDPSKAWRFTRWILVSMLGSLISGTGWYLLDLYINTP